MELVRPTDRTIQSRYDELCEKIATERYCRLSGASTENLLSLAVPRAMDDWDEFRASWQRMQLDTYMGDGGRYRRRRHTVLTAPPGGRARKIAEPRPVYQDLEFNSLNGGIARKYEPVEEHILNGAVMSGLVDLGCEVFGRLAPTLPWYLDIHQFRIEATSEFIGRPTPEGIHRDGVNFVLMMLVNRENVAGGISALYDVDKKLITQDSLLEPLDMFLVDDAQIFHGVNPIEPEDPQLPAVRDMLVITYKEHIS